MKHELLNTFKKLLSALSCSETLFFRNTRLLDISETGIMTPVGDILPLLLANRSKLSDHPVDFELLKQLIERLNSDQSMVRLNHVGFCYKVLFQEEEKERLIQLIQPTEFHVYQEKSNDDGLWLFIGDTSKWEEPLIELLPVEKTQDKWVDYWLPHIHIDIDTTLTAKYIENSVNSVFTNTIKPYRVIIDGTVYIVRNYLGRIDGVNIYLDLATRSRNVRFTRQHLLVIIG